MSPAAAALVSIMALPFLIALNGWALSVLWGWFVVPSLHAPPLGVVPAIGLSLVVGYMTHQQIDRKADLVKDIGYAVCKPLIALLCGWIYTAFM